MRSCRPPARPRAAGGRHRLPVPRSAAVVGRRRGLLLSETGCPGSGSSLVSRSRRYGAAGRTNDAPGWGTKNPRVTNCDCSRIVRPSTDWRGGQPKGLHGVDHVGDGRDRGPRLDRSRKPRPGLGVNLHVVHPRRPIVGADQDAEVLPVLAGEGADADDAIETASQTPDWPDTCRAARSPERSSTSRTTSLGLSE